MAIAKWAAPSARSANLAGTALNSIANGSETALISYDNATLRDLYAAVTVKLGSLTPVTGGSITLRVIIGDGTDVSNQAGGDQYTMALTSGASAKTAVFPMVRLYPFPMRFSVINNAGTAFAASGNELYVTAYNEDVT